MLVIGATSDRVAESFHVAAQPVQGKLAPSKVASTKKDLATPSGATAKSTVGIR